VKFIFIPLQTSCFDLNGIFYYSHLILLYLFSVQLSQSYKNPISNNNNFTANFFNTH